MERGQYAAARTANSVLQETMALVNRTLSRARDSRQSDDNQANHVASCSRAHSAKSAAPNRATQTHDLTAEQPNAPLPMSPCPSANTSMSEQPNQGNGRRGLVVNDTSRELHPQPEPGGAPFTAAQANDTVSSATQAGATPEVRANEGSAATPPRKRARADSPKRSDQANAPHEDARAAAAGDALQGSETAIATPAPGTEDDGPVSWWKCLQECRTQQEMQLFFDVFPQHMQVVDRNCILRVLTTCERRGGAAAVKMLRRYEESCPRPDPREPVPGLWEQFVHPLDAEDLKDVVASSPELSKTEVERIISLLDESNVETIMRVITKCKAKHLQGHQ